MNFNNIVKEIAAADPEVFERTSMRRDVIKNWSRKVALTALPFALGGMFKKAYGKTTDVVIDTLNFALRLEYLEAEFYATGYAKGSALIPTAAAMGAIKTIGDHETEHVNFLKDAITASGGTPLPKPTFDFTGGSGSGTGPFADVFTNYATFLAVAQAFEDTGVRAYKGQAGNLMGNDAVLQAALQIHSVEARHAAHIRQMRQAAGQTTTTIKPWITQAITGIGSSAVDPVYAGEDLDAQAGVTITGISVNGITISKNAATEAFDEPLTKDAVLTIAGLFIKP